MQCIYKIELMNSLRAHGTCYVLGMMYKPVHELHVFICQLLGHTLQGVVEGDTSLFFVGSQNAVS